jgi:hypothetical protein
MRLAPDELLCDGRYLLLVPCGADDRAGMEFWHARDVARDKDVALTVLTGDPADHAAVAAARHVLEGVRYAETAAHPALATVLDLPGPGRVAAAGHGVLGLVVCEWTDGVDLIDGVLGARLPVVTACRLLRPLVEAVDTAHHAGVVAGADAPGRIRIGEQGSAVLAFRGTSQTSTTRDDVRGLGAVLYLLLTGTWPTDGFVAPADLRPDVPRDLSMIAVVSLDGSQGPDIRTCGPLLRALDETIAFGPATAAPPAPVAAHQPAAAPEPAEAPESAPAPEPEATAVRAFPERTRGWRTAATAALRRRKIVGRRLIAAGVLVVAALAVLIGTQVAAAFNVDTATTAKPAAVRPPPVTTTTTTPSPTTTTTTTTVRPPPSTPVRPATVREYVVTGSEDNPNTLNRVADGDPGTTWKTDRYNQQFPSFAPGIGIMAQLPKPAVLASVTIASPSAGTVVQIRSASSAGVPLSGAPLLATATLHAGVTTIRLPARPATPYVLVWIIHLDDGGGGFQSMIGEITCQPAGQP